MISLHNINRNNKDDGEGSLRQAIRQGNEAVKEGKSVEIAFTSSIHIKAKTGYHLEKGDWTFNKQLTKNIIIDKVSYVFYITISICQILIQTFFKE